MDTATDPAVDESAASPAPVRRRRRVLLWTLLAVAVVLVALVAAGVWIGSRALAAKDSLERAESLVGRLQDILTADPAAAPALAERLVDETAAARADTDGLVWRMGEAVPVLGRNLSVVRVLAASVDDVARDAVLPLAQAGTAIEGLKPVDGALDMNVVRQLADSVAGANTALTRARDDVAALDADGTIGQVADAHARLSALLDDAADTAAPAAEAASLLVPLLGGDGPRNYLLMFQNPAEARSLGGNPASLLLMGVDEGRVDIVSQASSRDFVAYAPPPVPLEENLAQVYDPKFPTVIMDTATRPDFPTMAQLGKGYWEREFGGTVDAVVSFDPVALASLLDAVGPITLPSGDTLRSDNAVDLLLYEAYARYPDPADQDAFFSAAAAAIFDGLLSGSADPMLLLPALQDAIDEGRLMAWSANPEEQEVLARTPVAGILPGGNEESTTVGVYFNDYSASKMDYFVDTEASVRVEGCPADGDAVFAATYTITSPLTQEQAELLPSYVASGWLPRGQFRTDVYVVGPVGATFLDWHVDSPSLRDELLSTGTDLGRPVTRITSYASVEGTTTITVRFTAPAGTYGPLELRTTPMINPTEVAVEQPACG
ncbi:DUF4012 domain-containing protein [Naasia sp. SYSU D00057]|uniref:DUF4012 domain-containing protein n=1 Tax=Naasia sp. SYSU D00057 TaxID=2817380 RepID=UPI001B309743|nr:DUF4012 domain-containing protein [Naasia sp. SYSU D00057]